MKVKSNLFVLGLFICKIAVAQTWIEHDAVWHYDWSGVSSGGFTRIEYVKDTLILGKECEMLSADQFVFVGNNYGDVILQNIFHKPPEFTYLNGDTVFYLRHNNFFTLFNFAAMPGDSWIIDTATGNECNNVSSLIVDSVGTTEIDGINLRWISVHTGLGSFFGIDGKVIEKFGPIGQWNYLFPTKRNCDSSFIIDNEIYSFSCYQDDSFILYNVNATDCEYLLGIPSTDETAHSEISIFPNPTSSQLTIQSKITIEKSISIQNILGQTVLSKKLSAGENKISVIDLPAGLYLLSVQTNQGVFSEKILKE